MSVDTSPSPHTTPSHRSAISPQNSVTLLHRLPTVNHLHCPKKSHSLRMKIRSLSSRLAVGVPPKENCPMLLLLLLLLAEDMNKRKKDMRFG